jgi:DNA-binding transcriptional ArsR family regulator
MRWLNYHHLLYFWTVAREGSVTKACRSLHLTQPTISAQLKALEKSVKTPLFERRGRAMTLTEAGKTVYRYADEIFSLGRELEDVVRGRPAGGVLRLVVGVADTLPKLVVHRLLRPAFHLEGDVRVTCIDGAPDRLMAQLADTGAQAGATAARIARLEAQLADRNVTIETSDEAADWLAKNGFDELYGARPLARVIQEHIKKPLADEILFGRLVKGGHVKVVLKDSKLAFEIEGQTREPGAPEIESPSKDEALAD